MEKYSNYWAAICRECQRKGRILTREENLGLRDHIVECEQFAAEFFYKILMPMVSGYKYKIRKSYNVEVSVTDIATI